MTIPNLLFIPGLVAFVVCFVFSLVAICAGVLDRSWTLGQRLGLIALGLAMGLVASALRMFLLSLGFNV